VTLSIGDVVEILDNDYDDPDSMPDQSFKGELATIVKVHPHPMGFTTYDLELDCKPKHCQLSGGDPEQRTWPFYAHELRKFELRKFDGA
jgi:hypothetical protein